MSSGMNRTQAEEYAKTMTYKQAIGNIWNGKGIAYRKATMIKLHELAAIADKFVRCKDCQYSRVHQTDSKGAMQIQCVAFAMSRTVTSDDFCSWGERSEKE